jgi:nicotinamide-nucleotide amidase
MKKHPHLFLLPGPPRELHPMFCAFVLPILRSLVPADGATERRVFRIAGI